MSREYKAEQCTEVKEEEETPLVDLNLKELKKVAKERKIDIKGLKSEEDIIEAIENAEESEEEEEN